jgi:hypothetical protein
MDIPPISTLLTDIRVTGSRALATPDIRNTPLIPVLQAMDTQATWDTPITSVLRVMDIRATQGIPLIPVPQATDTPATRDTATTPVLRAMESQARRQIPAIPRLATKAARRTLPIPVPVIDTPCMAILAIEPRSTGRLGSTTLSGLLAEAWPKIHAHART